MYSANSEEFWKEGCQYLKTVKGGLKRPKIFTTDILYNLLALSIEKFFMASLIYNGDLADNHTFTDLIDSAARIKPVDKGLESRLKEAETYQNICPAFDGYMRKDIPREAIIKMVQVTEDVEEWAKGTMTDASFVQAPLPC